METKINPTVPQIREATVPQEDRLKRNSGTSPTKIGESQNFADFLEDRLGVEKTAADSKSITPMGELKFSAHARTRLESRGIELSPDELIKMQEAISKVGKKGSRESLILTDKAAFVVSIKNNTVITAVDRNSLKENIFTNIDSKIMI